MQYTSTNRSLGEGKGLGVVARSTNLRTSCQKSCYKLYSQPEKRWKWVKSNVTAGSRVEGTNGKRPWCLFFDSWSCGCRPNGLVLKYNAVANVSISTGHAVRCPCYSHRVGKNLVRLDRGVVAELNKSSPYAIMKKRGFVKKTSCVGGSIHMERGGVPSITENITQRGTISLRHQKGWIVNTSFIFSTKAAPLAFFCWGIPSKKTQNTRINPLNVVKPRICNNFGRSGPERKRKTYHFIKRWPHRWYRGACVK